ncbi:MAG: PRC-barrel domain-containing protein [Nanoarchaeota archaeon]|nr:PRC-barrel domain-containing protein [Nanoarchaeota archaeon]
MLKTKKITDTFEQRVYTDQGEYFGDIEECILTINKVFGWRVKATRGSSLSSLLGGAKGVIVPHQLVKAIGDVMIISKAAIPSYSSEEGKENENDEDIVE